MVVHAGFETLLAILRHRIGRERNDRHMLAGAALNLTLANRAGGVVAIHLGHVAIHQDEIEVLFGARIKRLDAVVGDHHAVALQLVEHADGDRLVDQVVLDQQHGAAAARDLHHGFFAHVMAVVGHALASHHVDQRFIERRLAHRLDQTGVQAGVARLLDHGVVAHWREHHHARPRDRQIRLDGTREFE